MIPRIPYLHNAVTYYYKNHDGISTDQEDYIQWLSNQGVITPIITAWPRHSNDINNIMLEFTDPELETMFVLRWA